MRNVLAECPQAVVGLLITRRGWIRLACPACLLSPDATMNAPGMQVVAKMEFAAAVNWCTHEYLFAFKGFKLDIPLEFVTLTLTLDALGLAPFTPWIKADLPGVKMATSEMGAMVAQGWLLRQMRCIHREFCSWLTTLAWPPLCTQPSGRHMVHLRCPPTLGGTCMWRCEGRGRPAAALAVQLLIAGGGGGVCSEPWA